MVRSPMQIHDEDGGGGGGEQEQEKDSTDKRMNAASFSTSSTNSAFDLISVILSTMAGMFFPPVPILVQSIESPSSRNWI